MGILLFALSSQGQVVIPNSEPFEEDNFIKFVENTNYVTNLQTAENQGLTKGMVAQQPWSGSYWPTHKGLLGNRYTSSSFAGSKRFMDNYQSIQAHPAMGLITQGRISELSPSEKYDLLIGDTNFTLTKHMWDKGFQSLQQNGVVAGWTGICHGWSAAASMEPTSPYSSVTVKDVTGQHDITFYANDVKAILSYLWAESPPNSFRAGNRCRKTNAPTDPYKRPEDPACLDTNPMTWHLAMINRVGMNKTSFVMDASSGPEVWNYPITGYDYTYFDPKTFIPASSLRTAVRPIETLTNDRYRAHRSPKARYIVGVVMDTFHPALTVPGRGNTNYIVTNKKSFVYDLELDAGLNVVGGEWYGDETPDFIWGFASGSHAGTREDLELIRDEISWSASNQMSEPVAALARSAAQRGEIVSMIAQALLEASKKPTQAPPSSDESSNVEEPVMP